jgi:hypothetical protein
VRVRSRSPVPVDLVTTNETTPDRGFWGGPTNETTPDRGFGGGPTNETTPQWGFFGGGGTGPVLETGFQLKKKLGELSHFFFRLFRKAREKDMANAQACPTACEEVLDVESKWPYLPITPTYDQYVQRWVVMSEREGFH